MKILLTGSAGFIGSALTLKLLNNGHEVAGVDNHNDYYDVNLKNDRLKLFNDHENYAHNKIDLEDQVNLEKCFQEFLPDTVINLAAQAGVRYSIENPQAYVSSNITGFTNVLELSKKFAVKHLVYASTSSIYGANTSMPFSEKDGASHPLSFYAATKKANELMAHSYSHLSNLPTTGLRFFTVYGPWGRPDMALFKFTKAILLGEQIDVFNNGNHTRDFTYIDDITEGIFRVALRPPSADLSWDSSSPDPSSSKAPWRVYNIGNNNPVALMRYIECLEEALSKKANIKFLPLQPGDVPDTYADVSMLEQNFGYKPQTSVLEGVTKFVEWYRGYYKL
jgi:UDP-glucuronate 4-epimerase